MVYGVRYNLSTEKPFPRFTRFFDGGKE